MQNKEQFFADLLRLDELCSDSDGDDEESEPRSSLTKPELATKQSRQADSRMRERPVTAPGIPYPSSHPSIALSRKTSKSLNSTRPARLKRAYTAGDAEPHAGQTNRKNNDSRAPIDRPMEEQIFRGFNFFFIPNSDANSLRRARIQKSVSFGAHWARQWSSAISHIIVDEDIPIQEAVKALPQGFVSSSTPFVRSNWVADCLIYNLVHEIDVARYRVSGMESPFHVGIGHSALRPATGSSTSRDPHDSDPQSEEDGSIPLGQNQQPSGKIVCRTIAHENLDEVMAFVKGIDLPDFSNFIEHGTVSQDGSAFECSSDAGSSDVSSDFFKDFLCMQKSDGTDTNHNAGIVLIFQQLADHYERVGDIWRNRAYRQGAAILWRQKKPIESKQQALELKGIGESLAEKISEINETGRLQKLDVAKADPEQKRLMLFMGIYGVGLQQAKAWIRQGYRTLDDLRQRAQLTRNQRIGLEHYTDLQQRIPRQEVEQLAAIVKHTLAATEKRLEMIVGGSYRRGSLDSGDVDILVTMQDAGLAHIRTLMTSCVIPRLKKEGFLKAELAASSAHDDGSKWHGLCTLPGSSTWRRIDLLYVPWTELGAALIYWTGNHIFNRSLRLLASLKGMRLNQRGLYQNVIRGKGRAKLSDSVLLEGADEKRIFEILKVPWKPPSDRVC